MIMNETILSVEQSNSELQTYAIQLEFDLAADETRIDKVPNYRYCFLTTPLYYSGEFYYDNDAWKQGDWLSLKPEAYDVVNNKAIANITLPSGDSDLAVQVLIEAQDDKDENKWSTELNTNTIAAFYKATPTVDAVSAKWESDSSFVLIGKITNHGFFKCANYDSLTAAQMTNYYAKCHSLFKVKMTNNGWLIAYGDRSELIQEAEETEIVDNLGDFTTNWATGKEIVLTKEFSKGATDWYASSETPYKISFTFTLNETEYLSTNRVQMAPFVPPFQILKGAVIAQLKKRENRYTGGAMLNHGVYTEPDGDSVALYDTAVPAGMEAPRNNPSIGFYNNEHKLLARIKYEDGVLKTEGADLANTVKWVDLD